MTEPLRPDQAEEALAGDIDNIVPSHGYRKVPLVGLAGSAGCAEALKAFFAGMPLGSGIAFIVFADTGEETDTIVGWLRAATRMEVARAEGRLDVQPGRVLVMPAGHALRASDGELESVPAAPERMRDVAIDIFFRTLADTYGAHAAAVVLSGVDGDGAIGIKRIKERGGLAVAQDPEQAAYASMPRSAIGTGLVDWVLPVGDMPARLLSYFRLENALQLPSEDTPAGGTGARRDEEAELRDVLNFLRTRTGRDFAQYKRATVLRRIARRMQVNGVENLAGYLNCLRTRPGEAGALLQDLLISVTNFFRDPDCFAALEQQIPALFQGKSAGDSVRVWVVACATGEEAYSVAILLSEYARTLESPPSIQVFATDLDEQAVQAAREGVYPGEIAADVSEERLRRYFLKEHRGWRVRRELRELVLFAVHDVLRDSPFSRLDLVCCRNLLIYLTRDSQQRVLHTLHFGLVPHGKLLLGSSESVDENSPLFSVLDKKHRIYLQRPAPRMSPRAVLALPSAPATLKLALEAQQAAREGPVLSRPSFDVQAEALPPRLREIARGVSWGDVHLQLLEQLAPPSVLVDADCEILHLSPTAGRFLQFPGGEPSRNLLRALPPQVRLELRAALFQASQKSQTAELQSMAVEAGGGVTPTTIRVVPMQEAGHQLFLVTFSAQGERMPLAEAQDAHMEADPLARHLDREMERLKLHLRDTVEQYEASTEELKASNEELQAMNEELRAATEELETSREELQSTNEELTTVNQELKSKVDQLSHANSDMHNLMDATAIATVFLDRDLRITRYTPAAVKLFNLIPTDVGRPLTDMATQLDYPELGDDARRVLERLVPVEREVGQADGSWYLARLMPYRTLDDRIAGVVFTFIDITERKQAEEMRLWLSAVVTSTTDGIISFALDQTILSWNTGAERIYGYTAEEAIGQPLALLSADGDEDQQRALAEIGEGRSVDGLQMERRRKDGSRIHVAITASPIRDASGRVLAGTAIVRDVTVAREQAEALRLSEERLRLVIESVREYAIFSTDLERRITSWNAGAQRILGFTGDEAVGRSVDMIFTDEDRAAGVPQEEAATALAEGRASDEREHRRKDGSRFRGSGVTMVMRGAGGEAVGFVKVLRDLSDRPAPPVQ